MNGALEVYRDRGAGGRELRRLLLENGGDDLDAGIATKGALARSHLVEHAAEGEDVRPGVGLFTLDLLGRHVTGGAHDGAGLGQGGSLGLWSGLLVQARQTEVEDLDPAVGGDEEIFRFQVPVNDAASVCSRESVGHRGADLSDLLPPQAGRRNTLAQGVAFQKLGDRVVNTVRGSDIVDLEEIRVR